MSKQKRPRQTAAIAMKRYTRQHPCPVCGGYASAQPPDKWCGGRLSEDGALAYCNDMELSRGCELVPDFIPAPRLALTQYASPVEGKAGPNEQ